MANPPTFDLETAHKYFSANCFNSTWDYIDKANRTPEEDEQMLLLAFASAWHWSQRTDNNAKTRSISFWQISRVYALLNQPDNARFYGKKCLDVSSTSQVEPFYIAYAYEALARAEKTAGNFPLAESLARQAREIAEEISDAESKSMVLADLETI